MIEFDHVTFTYPEADQPTLHDVSLFLPEGAFALLVGASGSGKSTLLRCINGLVPHFSGGRLRGRISVNGLHPTEAAPNVMSRYVGFVFQSPETQFVMTHVEDEIAFALENIALPPQEMRLRVEEVLDLLDLTPLRARALDTLSGGERQRVAIAAALAFRPPILILDEPTSQLDPKSAEDVLQALIRLNADLGLTILLAEHRLERVLPFVDDLIYLPPDGTALKQGDPQTILPQINLVPPMVELAKRLAWSPLPLTIKAGRRQSRAWLNAQSEPPSNVPSRTVDGAQPCLRADNIKLSLGGNAVLRGVDVALHRGEIVALLGRNGAGKTSLLKTLVGLQRPERGEIWLNDENITAWQTAQICQQVGYLPQNPASLLFADTVWQELLITLSNHGLSAENAPINPHTLLETVGLTDKANRYPRDLSVGEQQRVALAAITIMHPQILLLDEPTRGLDYQAKVQLARLLQQWQAQGMAILLVSHDVELVALVANRVILLSQGEVIANGAPTDLLSGSPLFAPQIARLFPETNWLTVEDVA